MNCFKLIALCKEEDLELNSSIGKHIYYNPNCHSDTKEWTVKTLVEVGWITPIEAYLIDEDRFADIKNKWIKRLDKFNDNCKNKKANKVKKFSEF